MRVRTIEPETPVREGKIAIYEPSSDVEDMFGVDGEAFSCSSRGKTSYMAVKTPRPKPKTVRIDEEESPT
eukprot:12421067-Karenia_brevis.AAC.1